MLRLQQHLQQPLSLRMLRCSRKHNRSSCLNHRMRLWLHSNQNKRSPFNLACNNPFLVSCNLNPCSHACRCSRDRAFHFHLNSNKSPTSLVNSSNHPWWMRQHLSGHSNSNSNSSQISSNHNCRFNRHNHSNSRRKFLNDRLSLPCSWKRLRICSSNSCSRSSSKNLSNHSESSNQHSSSHNKMVL